ncbi:MAG: hydrogenase expression/formation protein [Casimicrobiaceae bacterium]
MRDFPLPVRVAGPGSQPEDEEPLQYLDMPREMNMFEMPQVPDDADAVALAVARDVLAGYLKELAQWDPVAGGDGPRIELAPMPADALTVLNQVLGEGEVSIRISGPSQYRIQESVFTGIWRVVGLDGDGRTATDGLEAAALPRVAIAAARAAASERLPDVALPPGAMNSPALLAEIASQLEARKPGDRAHVINLTLFPMAPEDHQVLEAALPVGPVAIMSRGFGNCRVTSTGARDVWRVQYFNNMNTLILDTIEIVDLPEVTAAAAEDLEDSRVRMAELIEWMSESVAEATP